MGDSRLRAEGDSKKKARKVKRGKQDGTTETPTVEANSPYTPGSLTSFLQSAAASDAPETTEAAVSRKRPRKNRSVSGRKKSETLSDSPSEDAQLQKIRAFFESGPQKQEPSATEAPTWSASTSTSNTAAQSSQVTVNNSLNAKTATEERRASKVASSSAIAGEVAAVQRATKAVADSKERRSHQGRVASPERRTGHAAHAEAVAAAETEEERLRRTLFVGNLPVRDPFKPIELYRHLGLAKAQVESMRLRSVPVEAKFQKCRRAAIARLKFGSACDQQNAYIVLKEGSLVDELMKKEIAPFKGRELRLDSASRRGFSLYDRKRSVCIGGLPKEATEAHLKQALAVFGPVQNSRILRDRVTRDSKGLGFVCFADRGSATKAVLATTCTVLGRPVRLMRAMTEEECESKKAEKTRKAKKGGKSGMSPAVRRILARKERKLQKRHLGRAASRGGDAIRESRKLRS